MTSRSSRVGRHILVLPSEEYLPPSNHLAGIFQRHQIEAMSSDDRFRFGVISVRLDYSVPMYLRALYARSRGRRAKGPLGESSFPELVANLASNIWRPERFVTLDEAHGYPIVRAAGLRLAPTSIRRDHRWWIRAGRIAYAMYERQFGRPDLIHAHNALNAGLLACSIKARTGVPYVLTEHSSAFHQGGVPEQLKHSVSLAMANAQACYVVSGALRASVERCLGSLMVASEPQVLPNVLPKEFEDSSGLARLPDADAFTFLSVASHLPVKGLDILLRSFARLAPRFPGCRLKLVGDGPLRPSLEQLAAELGIGEHVEFLGLRSPLEVRAEMMASHALVISSRYETFGVVAIEAMACGLPVVSTRCGGPNDIVTSETGYLAKPDDVDALSSAMQAMILGRRSFESEQIRNSALSRFGAGAFASRMAQAYDAALEQGSSRGQAVHALPIATASEHARVALNQPESSGPC